MNNKKIIIKILFFTSLIIAVFIVLFFITQKSIAKESLSLKIKEKTINVNDFGSYKFDFKKPSVPKYQASNKLFIDSAEKEKDFTSKIYYSDFPFIAIGPIIDGIWPKEAGKQPESRVLDTGIEVELRILEKDGWTQWYKVSFDDLAEKEQLDHTATEYFGEQIFTSEGLGWQYRATLTSGQNGESPVINLMRFSYIDTRDAVPQEVKNMSKKDSIAKRAFTQSRVMSGPDIVSRAGWGNPEAGGSPGWPPEYAPVNKMIFHHTVGAPIGASTVLAIWRYHTYTRGWGDIGYNYLVDANGVIYEGRFGGNAVIGGHAYPANTGSIGIAAMGTYSTVGISSALFNSLAELASWKMYQNNLGPTIIGHRDVAATACPGNVLYSQLSQIRETAKQKSKNKFILAKTSSGLAIYFVDKINSKKFHIPNLLAYTNLGLHNLEVNIVSDQGLASYQNQTLMKGLGPKIYYIQDDKKRLIPSWEVFLSSGFRLENVMFVSDYILEQYPQGQVYSYLIKSKESSNVYYLEENSKRLVPDAETFTHWGFKWNEISIVDKTYLEQLSGGKTITVLTRNSNGQVYLMHKGKKRYVSSLVYTAWGFTEDQITVLASEILNSRSSGLDLDVLMKNKGSFNIYLMDQGRKILIPNPETFLAYGFKWEQVAEVPSSLVINVASADPLTYLTRAHGSPDVYLVDKLEKKLVPDMPIFDAWGFGDNQINNISQNILERIKTGKNLTLFAITESGKVYALIDGKKSWIVNVRALTSWKSFGQIYFSSISQSTLTSLVPLQGTNITHFAKIPGNQNVYLIDWGIRRQIPNVDTYMHWAGSGGWGLVSEVPEIFLNTYSQEGSQVTRIIKGTGPKIYFMENGYKRHIANWETYLAYRADFGDYSQINDITLSLIPTGAQANPFQVFIKSSGNFRVTSGGKVIGTGGAGVTIGVGLVPLTSQYLVAFPGPIYRSSFPIRVEGNSGVVLELPYYSDPNWNGSINYNRFRGTLEVVYSSKSNTLWVVNDLTLEDYLKGMAEAHSLSHFEHLKTMSVAERSYAYYHYTNGGKYSGEPFHLKNSRRGNGNDQVYAGYGYEAAAPRIGQASASTSGQVVTYGGTPVITPYSSGTDGRTRSAMERWGKNWPWCVSVSDPDCLNNPSCNPSASHMVGLSAYGGLKRAERGAGYKDILAYYYQGTDIGSVGNPNIRIAIYAAVQY